MTIVDPRWESVRNLQDQLAQKCNSHRQEIFLNAACSAVLDLIESGIRSLSLSEIQAHYLTAGRSAVRNSIRRALLEKRNCDDIEYVYYGSYIDAEIILQRDETKRELLQKFTGENREILERLFEGYSQKEIANDRGLGYAAVRQRISRIRNAEYRGLAA